MGIRAILLSLGILAACVYGVTAPAFSVYLYTWFALLRPDFLVWSPGLYGLSTVVAVTVLLSCARLLYRAPGAWFGNPIGFLFMLFQFVVFLSVLNAVQPTLQAPQYQTFLRMSAVIIFIPVAVQTLPELRNLILISGLSVGFIGLWHGVTGLMQGGVHIKGGTGGMLADNNTLAVALVMALPMCWYGALMVSSRYVRFVLWAMCAGTLATILMTLSRGGIISAALCVLLMIFRSKRKLLLVAVTAIMVIPTVVLMGTMISARMGTLSDVETEASAQSRITHAIGTFNIWKAHPLLGIGFADQNYLSIAHEYIPPERFTYNVPHNSFLQALAYSGLLGFTVFTALFAAAILSLERSIHRVRKTHPAVTPYPTALQTALIGYFISSSVQPRVMFDFYYIVLMLVIVWKYAERSLPEPQPATPAPPVPVAIPLPKPPRRRLARLR